MSYIYIMLNTYNSFCYQKIQCKIVFKFNNNIFIEFPEQFNQISFNMISSKLLPAQIRNMGFNKICLDSPTRKTDHDKPVGIYPCHRQGGNQVFCRSQFSITRQYHFAEFSILFGTLRFSSTELACGTLVQFQCTYSFLFFFS